MPASRGHAIATLIFGSVEELVGAVDGVEDALFGVGDARADTDRDDGASAEARMLDLQMMDGAAYPLGDG